MQHTDRSYQEQEPEYIVMNEWGSGMNGSSEEKDERCK